ncbi:MAG TPA: DUF4846 domain-containing protein [Flavitalea sp.]|nr:DUF4846 domain-containing protein [Flavitalea sp.]
MQVKLILTALPALFVFLHGSFLLPRQHKKALQPQNNTLFEHVMDIPVPAGFERSVSGPQTFSTWLRNIRLKPDNIVYLFDGTPKKNQSAQFAVLDIYVGPKDLQQCADAVMRLKAEYLYSQRKFKEIVFIDNAGKKYTCPESPGALAFEKYLEKVFSYCGTSSLEKQLQAVTRFRNIEPGNVIIKGGFPGHAVLVMDVAVNKYGRKLYLLAQSYMPAQSVHILRNPRNKLSPWYDADDLSDAIETPEWTFFKSQLKQW